MGTPLELFIYIALFALGLRLLVSLLGETEHDKRKLRAAHEHHRQTQRQRQRHRPHRPNYAR